MKTMFGAMVYGFFSGVRSLTSILEVSKEKYDADECGVPKENNFWSNLMLLGALLILLFFIFTV